MTPARPTLVAYYSRSGTTARVAHALAVRLGADELAIEDQRANGRLSVWRAALDRLLGTLPPIAVPTLPLESYGLVALGTPVWGGRAASPMRRFLHDYAPQLADVAFFCTMGGSGAETTFADMQARLGKPPRASCAFDHKAITEEAYLGTLDTFAARLTDGSHLPGDRAPVTAASG